MLKPDFPAGPVSNLPVFDPKTGALTTIIETPKGYRNKYKFDQKSGIFKLSGILPAGAVFPFDFGFIPSTLGPDGDPLDVLLLMDEPAFTGCVIPASLIGIIEAEQKEKGKKKERNDRLIAVSEKTHMYEGITKLSEIQVKILEEIEHFFISYNQLKNRIFTPIGRYDSTRARKVIKSGMNAYMRQNAR